jgi:hypothetical protein
MKACDRGAAMTRQLFEILDKIVALRCIVDRRTGYKAVVRMEAVTEKRLAVDLAVLREAHLFREMEQLSWVPSEQNGADPMTRFDGRSFSLQKTRLLLNPGAWVVLPSQTGEA